MTKLKLRYHTKTERLKEALDELSPTRRKEVCDLIEDTQAFILKDSKKQISFDDCLTLVCRLSTELFLEESLERLGGF